MDSPPVTHDVVMRSLRRRLWQALREENLEQASKVYTATMHDYNDWVVQEAIEAEQERQAQEEAIKREKKEKRDARPAALKKLNSMVRSTRHSFKQLECSTRNGLSETGRRKSFQGSTDSSPLMATAKLTGSSRRVSAPPMSRNSSGASSSGYGGIGLLELELNPSEPFTQDDFKSPHDSYAEQEEAAPLEKPQSLRKIKLRRKSAQPRLAGFFGRFSGADKHLVAVSTSLDEDSVEDRNLVDTTMTTPLHEAARLGDGDLVRLMLSHGGDPNVKNGQMRTALHMAAGGLTQEEEGLLLAAHHAEKQQAQAIHSKRSLFSVQEKELLGPGVGIRSNHAEPEESDDGRSSEGSEGNTPSGAKKAARVVGRFFRHLGKGNNSDNDQDSDGGPQEKPLPRLDIQKLNRLISDRMDAVLALLSWCYADDGSPRAGEGPSINSVDARGRTALHYASELGRTDVCMAVLSSFGAILTIVDESGQTPCELAGEQTHNALAAQLEARALLYADPYGMDDELMASVLSEPEFDSEDTNDRGGVDDATDCDFLKQARARRRAVQKHVIPPFSWFETWTMEEVRAERNERVSGILVRMREILAERQMDKAMNEIMFSHGGFDDSVDGIAADEDFNTDETSQDKTNGFSDELKDGDQNNVLKIGSNENKTELQGGGTVDTWAPFPLDDNDVTDKSERNQVAADADSENITDIDADTEIDGGNEGSLEATNAKPNDRTEVCLTDTGDEIQPEISKTHNKMDHCCDEGKLVPALHEEMDTNTSIENFAAVKHDECGKEEPLMDAEDGSSEADVWSAIVPDGVEPDERFAIALDDSEIYVRCPPDLEPGQRFYFTMPSDEEASSSKSSDSVHETNIKVIEKRPHKGEHGRKSSMMSPDIAAKLDGARNLVHGSHAELLLAFHGWSGLDAESTFRADPEKALREAGVPLALEATDSTGTCQVLEETAPKDAPSSETCLICCEEFSSASSKWSNLQGCEHGFCKDCLGEYIAETAQSRVSGAVISCPHHRCSVLLNPAEVKSLAPSSEIYSALELAADENFVATDDRLRFCPHPGCGHVVRYLIPEFVVNAGRDSALVGLTGAVCRAVSKSNEEDNSAPYTYEGIRDRRYESMNLEQPAKAHRFCFYCGESMHWPVTCERLEKWRTKVDEEVGMPEDEAGDGNENIEAVAHRLWIKANTRPCPQCKAPIEKNDGCNHMTCTNRHCRHEFCWICRKDWKLHNTETGGFFRCNKWQAEEDHDYYDEPPPPQQDTANVPANMTNAQQVQHDLTDQSYGTAIHSARAAWKKSKIMARFLHHYRRWTAHSESSALEARMADTVSMRLAPVVEAAIDFNGLPDFNFGGKGISFVHAAFTELLECRSVLQHSYAYAFFRYPTFYYLRQQRIMRQTENEKSAFENLQSQLEMLTEQLSDIVARSHLRATQTQIMFLTKGAAEKRREFSSFMIGIIDDERRAEQKKAERRREEEEEEENRAESPTSLASSRTPSPFGLDGPHGRAAAGLPLGGADEQTPPHLPLAAEVLPRDTLVMPAPVHINDQVTTDATLERAEEEAMREAVLASMQAYVDQSRPTDDLIESDNVDTDRWLNWSCPVCTYMNAGGNFCAMCGNMRS